MTPEQLNEARAVWQPIASAPRDGDDILLCWEDGGTMIVACWEEDVRQWTTLDGLGYNTGAFSHWMPLPAPPTILQEHPNG